MSGIEITKLCRTWGDVEAVKDVSFTVPEKSFTVLLGPSGCGKSTLLRMICGLESSTSGSVQIGGRDVTEVPAADRGVSMVFQSYALFPHLSVKENIQSDLYHFTATQQDNLIRHRHGLNLIMGDIDDRQP